MTASADSIADGLRNHCNAQDLDGNTPLHLAVMHRNHGLFAKLCDDNMGMSERDTNYIGNSPIHSAIERGDVAAFETLRNDRDPKTAYNVTPIQLAVIFARPAMVEKLLNDKAEQLENNEASKLLEAINDLKSRCSHSYLQLRRSIHWGMNLSMGSRYFVPCCARLWLRIHDKSGTRVQCTMGSETATAFQNEVNNTGCWNTEFGIHVGEVRRLLKSWIRNR